MVNRRLSSQGDPTVTINIKIPLSLKKAVYDLSKATGKSVSALFREWAASQIDSHAAEIAKLKQERRQKRENLLKLNKKYDISALPCCSKECKEKVLKLISN